MSFSGRSEERGKVAEENAPAGYGPVTAQVPFRINGLTRKCNDSDPSLLSI